MKISDDLVPGAATHTGPALVYLECGRIKGGYKLMPDEFVTSLVALDEARALAGLCPNSFRKTTTEL